MHLKYFCCCFVCFLTVLIGCSHKKQFYRYCLPNTRPAILSAYNRTRQNSLACLFIRPHIFHNQGQCTGTEAKRRFLSLNKRPLRQIVLPRLIGCGVFFFFFFYLALHEEICGRGQTFHLIKDTFNISSPLSPVISLYTHLTYSAPPHLSPLLFFSLSSIIASPKVPFTATVPFCSPLDAF